MSWKRLAEFSVMALLATACGDQTTVAEDLGEQPTVAEDGGVPTFAVDPSWPTIPNGWVLGQVSSVTVDGRDHVWVLHRPRTVEDEQQDNAAPPVLALASGHELQPVLSSFTSDPSSHAWHDVSPLPEYSPVGQSLHALAAVPSPSSYSPAGHAVQVPLLAPPVTEPAPHVAHSELPRPLAYVSSHPRHAGEVC